MGQFVLKKRLELDKYGDDWKGCFIELRELTIEEVQRIGEITDDNALEKMSGLLQKCFIGGKAYNGEAIVDLKKEDLIALPSSIFQDLIGFFTPGSEKKESV